MPPAAKPGLTLVVRQTVQGTPEQLFAAWTEPERLRRWWGPEGVECIGAELDLRVGGAYRIGNRLPDGTVLWIAGVFESIEPPYRLRYTWGLGAAAESVERVTVRFERRGEGTEVIVTHERIADAGLRDRHRL
ncbi:MAG TPA: SRPBCC domain-containing protein, partial [Gammaproteobacteria bacterium]|nr:SRPBCC domain-containing protein [Gammaproteobacteria bacterium]